MATTMLLRSVIRRRSCCALLSSSFSSSQSFSTSAAACSKLLTGDVKKPWASILPLGKQMASFGRPFSSRSTTGNNMEEKNVEDFEEQAAGTTYNQDGEPCFDDLQTEEKVKGPFEVRYGHAIMGDGEVVPFDQARVTIFKDMKETAESAYGYPLSRFVVIIPANVNDPQLHQMIKDAATTAGLDVQRIIVNEPTADKYPYGLPCRHGDPITTFDLSGPTWDTCVNEFHHIPSIVSSGKNVNRDNLLEFTVDYLKVVHGVDLSKDPSALQRVEEALARALVSKSKVKIKLPVADGSQLSERVVTIRDLPY